MQKALNIFLIIGFLMVDFFFFHDILKPGEMITLPQYMTGVLSIIVMAMAAWSLIGSRSVNA